ncbi:LON peptidase substrate-binding domain-containing protein [Caldimonas tepidiphila]|uniref:LON peptidase substrate-binding domain-containing protein n=1 Tax=Caldimonas tepidiphila TaxID=2315841 RepID=UPI000E5A126A|nr:LON peptidase substrate-binding domain-containing protein [Caldimonas tepidiphila]
MSSGRTLPLFPLQTVLFPDGLLSLKVFEARYLDLMGACVRDGLPFGVVALRQGGEVRRAGEEVALEPVGCSARLMDVDSPQPGILLVRCRGEQRFRLLGQRMQDNGLWIGEVEMLPDDPAGPPRQELVESARALASAIQALRQKGPLPFLEPLRFEDAGWIANRWCELLPIPLAARQKLMELEDPQLRLQIVDRFLRDKGIVA